MPYLSFHSPLGMLTLSEDRGAIVSLDWGWADGGESTALLARAKDQLDSYFAGQLRDFDLPLAASGTDFQKRVWQAISAIPYGQVARYGDLARAVGSAPRAVGGACGRNPIPIIVPCHRVLGSNGAFGGYSGWDGLDTKRYLLGLEGALPPLLGMREER
jgi:methylated-DNA-[protein]-cysteine S-methyltransferase